MTVEFPMCYIAFSEEQINNRGKLLKKNSSALTSCVAWIGLLNFTDSISLFVK